MKETTSDERRQVITKHHPFFGLETGSVLRGLQVAAIDIRDGQVFVELSMQAEGKGVSPMFFEKASEVTAGNVVTGTIVSVDTDKGGLYLQLCPGISAFLPALEVSEDLKIINSLPMHFPVGSRLECLAIDKKAWLQARSTDHHVVQSNKDVPYVSFLKRDYKSATISRPGKGDLIIGRVNQRIPSTSPPALSLEIRGGFIARCCVTELAEPDDWRNMPTAQPSSGDVRTVSDDENVDTESVGSDERRCVTIANESLPQENSEP